MGMVRFSPSRDELGDGSFPLHGGNLGLAIILIPVHPTPSFPAYTLRTLLIRGIPPSDDTKSLDTSHENMLSHENVNIIQLTQEQPKDTQNVPQNSQEASQMSPERLMRCPNVRTRPQKAIVISGMSMT